MQYRIEMLETDSGNPLSFSERLAIRTTSFNSREEAIKEMVEVGNRAANALPNYPTVSQCGVDEIGVFIGAYKVIGFQVVESN